LWLDVGIELLKILGTEPHRKGLSAIAELSEILIFGKRAKEFILVVALLLRLLVLLRCCYSLESFLAEFCDLRIAVLAHR